MRRRSVKAVEGVGTSSRCFKACRPEDRSGFVEHGLEAVALEGLYRVGRFLSARDRIYGPPGPVKTSFEVYLNTNRVYHEMCKEIVYTTSQPAV